MQAPVTFKAGCFVSQVHVLKVRVPDVQFKPFAPQAEAQG